MDRLTSTPAATACAPAPTASPTLRATSTSIPLPTATPAPTEPILAYVFPIQPLELAEYSQGHHDYPAVDIFAPVGATFVAVTNGIVDFVSREDRWAPEIDDPATRGGLSVAIVGGDGVRYYGSHLSGVAEGIEPGTHVLAGQVLGYVGATGNARGLRSHLHFGVSRPTFPEDWAVRRGEVDPYPYLHAWMNGEIITPALPGSSP